MNKNGKLSTPPCVKNWVITLQSFGYIGYIWGKLNSSFRFLLLKNINQDPLECAFGAIRSHRVRKSNNCTICYPTIVQFVGSFKTLLINNFLSTKSIGNCEIDDTDDVVLDNLKQFLMVDEKINSNKYFNDTNEFTLPLFQNISTSITHVGEMTIGYTTSYLVCSIMKVVKHCMICKNKLICSNKTNPLINCRAYTKKNLTNPTIEFTNAVKNILNIYSKTLPKICSQKLIGQKLNVLFEINSDLNHFECLIHQLKEIMKSKVVVSII